MPVVATQIILIGPTGAGKSTVGRLLAAALKQPFFDLDEEIVVRAGADIPWIFDVEGEAGFRDREARALAALMERPLGVISTGAGVVVRADTRQLLQQTPCPVVWLKVDLQTQFERLRHDRQRPLLQVEDPEARLAEMAATRNPWYADCASFAVQTGRSSPNAVVRQILKKLKEKASDTIGG